MPQWFRTILFMKDLGSSNLGNLRSLLVQGLGRGVGRGGSLIKELLFLLQKVISFLHSFYHSYMSELVLSIFQRTMVNIYQIWFFDFLENQGYIRASSLCFLRIMGIYIYIDICLRACSFDFLNHGYISEPALLII